MPRYLYTVWFRDELAAPGDEDREWPACFAVEAPSVAEAQAWGDHLARGLARRRGTETFLRSGVEEAGSAEGQRSVPVVALGHEATDAEIGW